MNADGRRSSKSAEEVLVRAGVDPNLCRAIIARHRYPLLFATVSGAHLYGFPSPDSDYDLRGTHILPATEVLGLGTPRETVESAGVEQGVEIDLVTHDLLKFFRLLLKKNGYVLEQLYSPLIVHEMPEHDELKAMAHGCITRHHVHHYLGFLETQWRLFLKESPPRVKPLLYVYRVLLTGIHLMRTGLVEANLLTLNREFGLPYIDELVARKREGPEKGARDSADLALHTREKERLEGELLRAGEETSLPEAPSAETHAALNDLLLRVRMGANGQGSESGREPSPASSKEAP